LSASTVHYRLALHAAPSVVVLRQAHLQLLLHHGLRSRNLSLLRLALLLRVQHILLLLLLLLLRLALWVAVGVSCCCCPARVLLAPDPALLLLRHHLCLRVLLLCPCRKRMLLRCR
jgi:hypothetical protein